MRRVGVCAMGWALVVGVAASASAQVRVDEAARLGPSDGLPLDVFGDTIAVDGDVALIGASGHDAGALNAGAAYVMRRIGGVWVEEQKLLAADGTSTDAFGVSVALDGIRAVVGAPFEDEFGFGRGAVYVFEYDGAQWNEVQKLVASDAGDSDRFGESVAIDGDWILVGADGRDDGFDKDVGRVYAFEFDGVLWNEVDSFQGNDSGPLDTFGAALSMAGHRVAVGAPGEDGQGASNRGAVYVFERTGSTWDQADKVTASDESGSALFGTSVGLADPVLIAGAPNADFAGSGSGAAYVFRRSGSTWQEEQILVGHDTEASDNVGITVAASETLVAFGATRDDEAGTNAGAAYAFRDAGGGLWVEQGKLIGTQVNNKDSFGRGIAMDGGRVLVGSPSGGTSGGAVDVFDLEGLSIDAQPSTVAPGDSTTLWAGGGVPGTPMLLFLTAVNGIPFPLRLLQIPFDADGRVMLTGPIPVTTPVGTSFDLQVFGLAADGQIVQSSTETIQVQ